MATFNITTTSDQDAAVQYYTDQFNARMAPAAPMTARDWFIMRLQEWLNNFVQRSQDERNESRRVLASRASAADLASIDTILDKYRSV